MRTKAEAIAAAPGVALIRLGWSNSYVLHGERSGFTLVDAGTARDKIRLAHTLSHFAASTPARTHQILLTHAHPDHAGCAAFVARRFRARVMAHEEERPFLERGRLYGARRWNLQKAAFELGARVWPVRSCHLSRALSEGDEVETGAGVWRVLHLPGHTMGQIGFFRARDGVLLSGDALLNVLPWTRRSGLTLPLRLFSDDFELARQSARRIVELQPRVLLPGHGPPLLNATSKLQRFVAA
jgi:glyoxylase-like metal-dependent hydrolase (beta-lactamase superfamily II)